MKLLAAVGLVLVVLLQATFAQTTVSLQVLSPSNGRIQYQQQPIYSTTVNPASAGSVTVYVDGATAGSCTPTNGHCNVTEAVVLTVGSHTAFSSFVDGVGARTNSSNVAFSVYATTILTLTSVPSGEYVPAGLITFTVNTQNIPSNLGGPTGVISIYDVSHGGVTVGTCVITGVSSCSTNSTLSPNTNYTFTANYPGDNTFDSAASPSITVTTIVPATTTTTATTATATTTTATATTGVTGNTTTVSTLTSGTSGNGNGTTATSTSTSTSTTGPATTSTTGPTSTTTTTTGPITTGPPTTGQITSGNGTTTGNGTTSGNSTTTGNGTTSGNGTHPPTPHPTAAPTTSSASWLPSVQMMLISVVFIVILSAL